MITDEIYFRETVSSSTSLFTEKGASDETDLGWSSGIGNYTLGTIVLSSDEEEKNQHSDTPSPTKKRQSDTSPNLTPSPLPRNTNVTQSPPPKIPARRASPHQRAASHRHLQKPENKKTFTVKITVDRECKLQ